MLHPTVEGRFISPAASSRYDDIVLCRDTGHRELELWVMLTSVHEYAETR
jgi:hypothetical protein